MRFFCTVSLCVFCALCLAHAQLFAQDTGEDTLATYQIDEVVSTGTRTVRKIIDIPYSVQRLDNIQFKFEKKTAVSDVLGTIPGLFMQSRYGNHDVRISIRGFGSRSNSGIRGVRILLDDIPESEPDGQTRIEALDFNSIGSIEVVKGNASSLYTNAPGGVINFLNDLSFSDSFVDQFNEFGSYGLKRHGFKLGVAGEAWKYMLSYSYHAYEGYRAHSQDYWNIVNTVLEMKPSSRSSLKFLGYFVDGLIRLPGSLTAAEYQANRLQAASREKNFDYRRISKKGRVGVRFRHFLDKDNAHEIEATYYGTIKYFERPERTYRIIDRWGHGGTLRYVNKGFILDRANEFTIGADLFGQYGPISTFNSINGGKGDNLTVMTDETIANVGVYALNSIDLFDNRMALLLTGRYDRVIFDQVNRLLAVQNATRIFKAFTPKAALNFKITPTIAAYTSFGLSFDSPAANELDNFPTSSDPGKLINPDLNPQKSKNFELGVKGSTVFSDLGGSPTTGVFEVTFFNSIIDDEIVPFEVQGTVYYRNSARTRRTGLEVGADAGVIGGLRLKASYTLSDFVYLDYKAAVVTVDTIVRITERTFSGNVVPSVPKHNATLGLLYEHAITENTTGFTKLQYHHVSGLTVDDANSARTGGYNIVGLTAGLDILIGSVNVLLNGGVQNMLDASYVGFVNINSSSGRFYEAGEPRIYFGGLRLGYRI